MAVRTVLRYPHPILKRPAAPCTEIDERMKCIAADLLDTMRAHPRCVGLAAPQIGAGVRIVVVDVTGHPKASTVQGLLILFNPMIVASEGYEVGREGCLSLPEVTVDVVRASRIQVKADGSDGQSLALESQGFEARAIQHEIDHLDGILILDRAASPAEIFARRPKRPAG